MTENHHLSQLCIVESQKNLKNKNKKDHTAPTIKSRRHKFTYEDSWDAQSLELAEHDCLFVVTEFVRQQLYQLNIHKSMEPDRIHPRVWKELGTLGKIIYFKIGQTLEQASYREC